MNATTLRQTLVDRFKQRPLVYVGAAALMLVLLSIAFVSGRQPKADLSFYEARRGDFLVSVVEGGTLEAVNEVVVRSEFEGTARVIFIAREGIYVKKGDLLVELDSSQAQDQVNQSQINFEKAEFAVTQAEQQLTIQKSIVEGDVQAAELTLKFAQIDLDKYLKGEREQARRNAEIEISNVVETLNINKDKLEWTKKLYEKGYETKSRLDQDELAVSEGLLKLEQATNAFWMLRTFDEPKKGQQLRSTLDQAQENLARVKLQGERRLAQFEADVRTQKNTLELSLKKLERDKKQLAACRIPAPQDGLVVYPVADGHFSSESMIEEGATVRYRQPLIKLPDVFEMKLEVKIHESHINNIREGQQAFVVLDSMPDLRFQGLVNKVGIVPDTQSRWGNPNLKVYATQVIVTDKLPDVKPGVSAKAEIIITNLQNVISVPIQAVTTRKGKQVAFLAEAPARPVPVSVGMYNTKFIEVTSGLNEGDHVLLSLPFDTEDKDLGGGILAKGEKLPAATGNGTNTVARRRASPPNGADPRPGAQPNRGGPDRNGAAEVADADHGRPAGARGETDRMSREEMLKEFDKDGDGKLNETEREAMRVAMATRFASPGDGRGGGQRVSPEEMLKRFDKNGDGELDDQERAAMREALGRGRSRTNAAPAVNP
jgi:HlyD family secretion protein